MRTLMIFLVMLMLAGGVLAQTPAPTGSTVVTVTTRTGADGTAGNLIFTLSGKFSGVPLTLLLDQPGDLQPGLTNSYSFSVPYNFCDLFQFQLALDGDDWLGDRLTITLNGIDVWFDGRYGDSGALTAGNTRGGRWDGTDVYLASCATLPTEVSFVTGANGTVDDIFFYLEGDFSASPYLFYFNQPGDLQPGQTDTYRFRIPMDFCQVTGWRLNKAMTGAADDDWLPTRIDISIGGTLVFFDAVFNEVGPILFDSFPSGTWDGTEAYQTACDASGAVIVLPDLPLEPIVPTLIPPVQIIPTLIVPPIEPIIPTLIAPPGGFPVFTPEVIDEGNPNGAVSQCQGAPPPRLEVGGIGRVTPGAPNRLRAQPSTGTPILGNMPAGSIFNVIDGPSCGEGYNWWQVNYNGIIGWTAEGTGGTYFLEPV